MGALVTGVLGDAPRAADVLVVDGRIAAIGTIDRAGADVVVDCRGTTTPPS